MGIKRIPIVCYADDAVLLANLEDYLQRLLHTLSKTVEQYHIIITSKKTKLMVISKDPIRCKLMVDNKIIQKVMKTTYLGVEISSTMDTYNELYQQVIKGARTSRYLKHVTWRNKYLNTESKVKIYKNIVLYLPDAR